MKLNLIDDTRVQSSITSLINNLGCLSVMNFQEREIHKQTAIEHVMSISSSSENIEIPQHFSNSLTHRSPYLVVVGLPGTGKSRFLYEVGSELERRNYLVLASTFGHNTPSIGEDHHGVDFPQFPVVARLLFQYARKNPRQDWHPWCRKLIDLHKTYNLLSLLELENVVNFLKKKYSKEKAVLLIDETYRFVQNKKFDEQQMKSFMREIVSIQDRGVAVIFSAFVAILIREESLSSLRLVEVLNMSELTCGAVKNIMDDDRIEKLKIFSVSLGMTLDQTMELLYSCIGGLPRIVEGLWNELKDIRHFEILSVIHAVGHYIGSRSVAPSYQMIMTAMSSKKYHKSTLIQTTFRSYTIRDLQIHGLCSYNSESLEVEEETNIILTCDQLFSFVYNTTNTTYLDENFRINFRGVLKQLLVIPMIKNHNIWEEFVRKLVILKSLQYVKSTNIDLSALFHPALQVDNCLTKTRIVMKNFFPYSIRYIIPPSPENVKKTPSIWFPDDQMESGVDTLMFFRRRPIPSSTSSTTIQQEEKTVIKMRNLICVGIQNKWSSTGTTPIAYSSMRKTINHFISNMSARGWADNQLFFIFITNQSVHQYIVDDLCSYFNEQVGIISSNQNNLEEWLSPTMKVMIERFQNFAKHYPSHENFNHEITNNQIDEYVRRESQIFQQLTQIDQDDPKRKRHIKKKQVVEQNPSKKQKKGMKR